ncbi:MAG: putative membrane-anchored protein [Gammaproteobacteria bacterium]|jgi:uncharacterized membrane-anchored protein
MILDKTKMLYGLIAIIVLQLSVLVIEYGNAVFPLLTGKEIKIKVVPVDPRSLFRGNYARLNYDISRVKLTDNTRELRKNEIVYVSLKLNEFGLYEQDGVSLLRPDSGIFIRGRTQETRTGMLQVRYGIEAFFAPKEKALDLESKLRSGGIAIIMIAKNGKSALKDIIAEQS